MEIPLTVSETMDERGKLDINEHRVIRMPKDFRDDFMFDLNDFVSLRSADGKVIALRILPAYKEDAEADGMSAYITSDAFIASRIIPTKDSKTRIQNVELVQGITLGCDPELFLVDAQGNMVHANRFFRRFANVGYDGPMLELRPMPSTKEEGVSANLMSLLNQARAHLNTFKNVNLINNIPIPKTDELRIVAASAYKSVAAGFHLHFGLPRQLLGGHKYMLKLLAGQMVKALDFYVGIPAIIPEGSEDFFRRTFVGSAYGKPGNFILDNRTLEYRLPGGTLMKHPILAQGILGLGAAVIEDVVSRVREATENYSFIETMLPDKSLKIIYPSIPTPPEIYQAIVSPNIRNAEAKLDVIINDVRKMVGYEARSQSIEAYFKHIKTKFSNDVECNWREYYAGQQRSVDLY